MKIMIMLSLLLTFPLSGYCAQSAEHQHHASGHPGPSLNQGKKWASDPPLRQSMDALRIAFQTRLAAIHHNNLATAEYKKLGDTTHSAVANIVAKCKLQPEADAALHLIIADMLAGADAMTGKTKGKPSAGARKVVSALNSYGQSFDHPGWIMLK